MIDVGREGIFAPQVSKSYWSLGRPNVDCFNFITLHRDGNNGSVWSILGPQTSLEELSFDDGVGMTVQKSAVEVSAVSTGG